MATAIAASGVTKRYPPRGTSEAVLALDDVSFHVEPGQFVTLVGPSGCGKSTLLRLVAGLDQPSHGVVEVGGVPVSTPRRSVGFMFQNPTLLPWRSALANVLLPLEVESGGRAVGQAEQRARDLLELVQLQGFEQTLPAQLSGGMQQRVALARVLMTEPELLLLDEPFGALDELTRDQLDMELLRICQARGTTVAMVTHSVHEAVLLSDRVLVFSARPGRIVADLAIDLTRPRTAEVLRDPRYQELVVRIRWELGLRD